MKPIRVLIVAHNLVNELSRRRVDELAKHPDLALDVLTPSAWTGSHGEQYAPQPARGAWTLHPRRVLFRGRNQQHLYVFGPGLAAFVREVAPDVVHIEEEPYSLVTFQAAWTVHRQGLPFLLTIYQNLDKYRPAPFAWTQAWVLARARAALVGGSDTERMIRRLGYRGPTTLASLGIDPAVYRPGRDEGLARELGLAGHTIGFVGRLAPLKGLEVLLRALALRPAGRLVIVGGGALEAPLKRLAGELGVRERTTWVGPVPHDQVPRYLNLFDVLAMPSVTQPGVSEQFGRVLVEAMACGIPVIGSTCGEIPRVLGDAGLLFPETDAPALARCLAELESPARRAELAAKGRERVARLYTWEAIARETADVYRAVARGQPA